MTDNGRLLFVGNEQGGDWSAGFGRPLWALCLGAFVAQRFVMLMAQERAADMERLSVLVQEGKVTPVIDRVCPLDGVVEAMRDLEAGKVVGTVVVSLHA